MSLFRRLQAPVVAALLVLLTTPAVAACCLWTPAPAACCEESDEAGLAARCCITQADQPGQQLPASAAKVSRFDSGLLVATMTHPAVPLAGAFEPRVDPFAGPPRSDPLYLRLSVIRR